MTKTFGPTTAVNGLDLCVPRGGLYGFIGPNGAGKTTTLRIIMSILLPDRGDVSVLGLRSALDAKDRVGYLPEERGVYRKMRVGAFLSYIGRLKGVPQADLARRIRRWLERVELGDVERKPCEELSKGMLQKVQLIVALLHEPDLLVLDEPFAGLDPVNMRLLRDVILAEHRRGATILFSTHVMVHAEEICEHVVMIHRGRKVLDDSLASIRRRYDPRTIHFEPLESGADTTALRAVPGVEAVTRNGNGYRVDLIEGSDPARAMREITAMMPSARVELDRPTLEDVFLRIVAAEGSRQAGQARQEVSGEVPA